MKLDNYYNKTETYSQNEIDDMFDNVNDQAQLLIKLLDIKNYVNDEDYIPPDTDDNNTNEDNEEPWLIKI